MLRINSTGQRGADLGIPDPAQRRVLFLGDSFTMSSYLAKDITFVDLIGRRFKDDPEVVAINGGVDGYGTYQQLAYYRYFGRPLQPDLVVLCFFIGNDWRDNMISTRQGRLLNPVLIPRPQRFWRHEDPSLRGDDERVLGDPLTGEAVLRPSRDWAVSLMRQSLLARLIGSRYARLRGRWAMDLAILDLDHRYYFYEIGFYQRRGDGLFATARDLTLACLAELKRLVAEDGAELAVVLLPSQNQVDRVQWLRMLDRLGAEEAALGELDMEYPNQLLVQFCRRQRIPFLDLTARFAQADEVADLYLTAIGDGHLSARGQVEVADELSSYLLTAPFYFRGSAVGSYRKGQQLAAGGDAAGAEDALLAACASEPDWSVSRDALGDLYRGQRRWT
ncbi:MAG: hypothetical protein VX293_08040, partial [Candidatus Latescibacterota bacterium]|nr:hypothetical protein [Candidatus Latescibacterota bacterium]